MRNPDPQAFWTNLGTRLCGHEAPALPAGAPWAAAWAAPPVRPPAGMALTDGSGLRPRKIWGATSSVLAPMGFSRALRLEPWPDIELFLPFYRGDVAVMPQGFSDRIPTRERAFALAGKSAAAWACGCRMVVCLAGCDPAVLEIFREGGVACATAGRLAELLGSC